MLTSTSQYLTPEYLSPLPTTLDSKKSPLALLAQTCSNIGADNGKLLLQPLEKSKDAEKSKERSFSSLDKSSFKPYDANKREDGELDTKRPPSKVTAPEERISTSGSRSMVLSPASDDGIGSKTDNGDRLTPVTSPAASSPSSSSLSGTQCDMRGLGYTSSSSLSLDMVRPDHKEGISAASQLSLSGVKGLTPLMSNCSGCGPLGNHIPMDSGLQRPASYPLGSYLSYARVKTTLVPLCRDPFCSNCQLNLQSAHLATCAGGCAQCTHDRLLSPLGQTSLSAISAGYPPSLHDPASSVGPSSTVHGLYPLLPRPNVCSWMMGDSFCGKRFATSEELLQHLRTHTTFSFGDSSSLSLFSPSVTSLCPLTYSSATALTTPAGLRRTYPTSGSPLSSPRYHPYKPSSLSPLPVPTLSSMAHPGLGMYYSPYSLYGQRLGPPVPP